MFTILEGLMLDAACNPVFEYIYIYGYGKFNMR